jgi:nitrogen fixation protein FixH
MSIRPFFWWLLTCTCVGVLFFAYTFRQEVPALMHFSLNQPVARANEPLTLTLRLTDPQGLPIKQAHVIASINMTNMDMGVDQQQLQAVGPGKYTTPLHLSMTGPWIIQVMAHANGFLPTHQNLYIEVVSCTRGGTNMTG